MGNIGYLREALAILAQDAAPDHRRIRLLLRSASCWCRIDRESFRVRGQGEAIEVGPAQRARNALRVETTADAILRLVDGRQSLEAALASNDLLIFGNARSLLLLASMCDIFMKAALRSRRLQDHFDAYRAWAGRARLPP